MVIDRSNYEIWLIDWLDGNLSSDQIETVMSFLEINPDIKAEFDEMSSLSIKPQETNFLNKEKLKKSLRELSISQFEYLSIAYLENDLRPAQLNELNEIIGLDPEKARTHTLIQKTKLNPLRLTYLSKYQLIKRPVRQRVIRLSIIGLSVAATIGLVITSYLVIPDTNTNDTGTDGMHSVSAITPIVDTNGTHYIATTTPNDDRDGKFSVSTITSNRDVDGMHSVSTITPIADTNGTHYELTTTPNGDDNIMHSISTEKIIFQPNIDLNIKTLNNALIASTFAPLIPSFDDGRSNVRKFFARNFRQKLLREKDSKDTPLKPYEIAEAGVNGLNKLLGWQMALNTVNNEYGEPASVYFTSKLLKFNTPVKKNQ
jgi:hypothetical protein